MVSFGRKIEPNNNNLSNDDEIFSYSFWQMRMSSILFHSSNWTIFEMENYSWVAILVRVRKSHKRPPQYNPFVSLYDCGIFHSTAFTLYSNEHVQFHIHSSIQIYTVCIMHRVSIKIIMYMTLYPCWECSMLSVFLCLLYVAYYFKRNCKLWCFAVYTFPIILFDSCYKRHIDKIN